MADIELAGRITAVTQKDDGFKMEGYEDYFNLGNRYQGPRPIPPAGSEVVIVYNPWTGRDGKVRFSVNSLSLAGAAAPVPVPTDPTPSPVPTPAPAPDSYDGFRGQEEAPHPASNGETEAVPPPEPGTFAYRDLVNEVNTRRSIESQKALQCAVDTLRMRVGENIPPWESDEKLKTAVLDVAGEYLRWLRPAEEPAPEPESEPVAENP